MPPKSKSSKPAKMQSLMAKVKAMNLGFIGMVVMLCAAAFAIGFAVYKSMAPTTAPAPPKALDSHPVAPEPVKHDKPDMEDVDQKFGYINQQFTKCPVAMSFYYSNGNYYAQYKRFDDPSVSGIKKGPDAHKVVVDAMRAATKNDKEAAACAVMFRSSVKDACGVDTSDPDFMKQVCTPGQAFKLKHTDMVVPGFETDDGSKF
ncbi:hypothetical protein TetV_312 [Tetraselmis virus 1]|uniref:Uncharacterized protein n=1 Tax=Tetraselmis virus 1 TaxID=2060617 RepID=A0A2P0VNC1_9VIRU|nr:hypothetical protein QJ968_gp312 [Tetraselmis virus 1]AUF82404.1 hypothetical protein TetV_312 [Tetraselmis virus 1]